ASRTRAASGLLNGRWVIGGGAVATLTKSAIAWDPAANTWTSLAQALVPRTLCGGATIGQSFYMVAGGGPRSTTDVQQYTEPPCTCSTSYSDVHPADYFYTPVIYLSCHGAISGYADGTFRPYNNTTRGQLAKIVVLAEGWPINTSGGPHFSDVLTSNPFYMFIETPYNPA